MLAKGGPKLKEATADLLARHLRGASGLEITRERTAIIDVLLIRLFNVAVERFERRNKPAPPAVALVALAAGWAGERRWGGRFRPASLWGFVLASALTWSVAPMGLAPLRIDAAHGLAGMLGWALFALALAAPSLDGRSQSELVVDAEPLVPRRRLARGDAPYLVGAAAMFDFLQFDFNPIYLVWLFVALAAGLAVIDAASTIALARHARRVTRAPRIRLRAAMAAVVLLGILALTGLLFVLRG